MWFLAYFFLHLSIYTFIRVVFFVWNHASLAKLTVNELFWAFLNGLRFDLSALAFTVGLCFLGLIWFSGFKIFRNIWLGFFVILNVTFIMMNFGDAEFYNFTAKRFTVSSLIMLSDGKAANLITPYIPLASTCFAVIFIYIFVSILFVKKFHFQASLIKRIGLTFVLLLMAVVASRGGLQHKPLTFVDAKLFTNTYANNLVLNSTFTFLKSATHKSLNRVSYFAQDEMLKLLNAETEQKIFNNKDQKPNIVVFVLEGFSQEYTKLKDPVPTPYLNNLRSHSADFKNAYANGRRSIEGIAAILSGIPALMEEPFINSEFSANQIIGLGSILASNGYDTSFFHAANKGSMHFDAFTKSVGIDKYFSRSDYPNAADDDGTWGIFDEPYLQWACEKLTEVKAPFFTTLYTLSSHHPYVLPPQYTQRFKDERLPILKSVQYSDYAIQKFMECAAKKPWYGNTIFIFTSDHTGPELQPGGEFISRYHIPFFIYGSGFNWIKQLNTNQIVQQIDILPTILDILNIEQKNVNYLSRSLLRDGPKLVALYSDGHYELTGDVKDQEKQLKAVKQYFSEGLFDNRLYYPSK